MSKLSVGLFLFTFSAVTVSIIGGAIALHCIIVDRCLNKIRNYCYKQLKEADLAYKLGNDIKLEHCIEQADAAIKKLEELNAPK